MDWYLKVLKNYIGFGGRARRKEYWMFILVNLILTGVLSIIDKMLSMAYWSFYRGGRCNFAVCMTPIVRPGGYCCC